MVRQESLKILASLKAAYPNSFRNLSHEDASATANTWAYQFSQIPYEIVAIAVQKLISTSTYPPSIAEVKKAIGCLHYEAWGELNQHYSGMNELDPKRVQLLERIMKITSTMKDESRIAPSLNDMLDVFDCSSLAEIPENSHNLLNMP